MLLPLNRAPHAGVTVWRNSNATRRFAAQWSEYMDNNELHQQGVDDQFSFNALMTSDFAPGSLHTAHDPISQLVRSRFPMNRVEWDPKVFYAAPGGSLKLLVLPSALFAGASWQTAHN